MLKIQRSSNGQIIFTLIGRMKAERVAELKALFKSETGTQQIVLDLKDLTLVDRDSVRFIESCEADGIKIKNCPAYVREWMEREKDGGATNWQPRFAGGGSR